MALQDLLNLSKDREKIGYEIIRHPKDEEEQIILLDESHKDNNKQINTVIIYPHTLLGVATGSSQNLASLTISS